MPSLTVKSPSIHCDNCVRTIERELRELPGVTRVQGDVASKTIVIDWEAPANLIQIAEVLQEIGYPTEAL
jgi:copper chaperone CopZ